MPDKKYELTPKTALVVTYLSEMSVSEHKVFEKLYLPLIGPVAYSLYAALESLMVTSENNNRYHSHAELLSVLGIDLPTVLKARYKLEATGLLRSFFNTEGEQRRYIYQLQLPMTAVDFFSDDLMSVLLLDTVGEHKYRQLADDFIPSGTKYDLSDEVTANILDVFHFNGEKIVDIPNEITTVRTDLPTKANDTDQYLLADETYDWKFLGQVLKANDVDLDEVSKNRQLIINESRIYGISELEMGRLISSIASVIDGKFDTQRLRIEIAKKYRNNVAIMSTEERQHLNNTEPQKNVTKAKQQPAFSQNEKKLFKIATETSPNDFLQQMKLQKGGNVTDGERWVLRTAIKDTKLPNSVINMLIYHLLVDEDLPTLNKRLFETIADDWQQAKVTTPELVVEHIRERDEKKRKKATQRKKRQNSRPVRKEVIPEWAKRAAQNKPQRSKNQLSAEQRKQLAEQIEKMDDN